MLEYYGKIKKSYKVVIYFVFLYIWPKLEYFILNKKVFVFAM